MRYLTKRMLDTTEIHYSDEGVITVLGAPELFHPQHHEVKWLARMGGSSFCVKSEHRLTVNPTLVRFYSMSQRPVWVEIPDDIDDAKSWLPARHHDVSRVVAHERSHDDMADDHCGVNIYVPIESVAWDLEFSRVWSVDDE